MTNSWLKGKSVLITGAAGTVGGGLLDAVHAAGPLVVRAMDHHEHGLFALQQRVGEHANIRWLLGDVRDSQRLRRAMGGVDVVFHTAALKHVGIGEYNPFEIVQTNLLGLQNVIQASLDAGVERMIFTSSDKAVNPTNAMGASKLMGERLVAAAHGMRGSASTRFASVRFGNILGSKGSVAEVFHRQIASGGPVTLTDERMTRYVMGLQEAVGLVLEAARLCQGGELFVLKMRALKIEALAQVMIRRLAKDPESVKFNHIGPRSGEKLYEELLSETEQEHAWESDRFLVFPPEGEEVPTYEGERLEKVNRRYDSSQETYLTDAQIEAFLEEIGVVS